MCFVWVDTLDLILKAELRKTVTWAVIYLQYSCSDCNFQSPSHASSHSPITTVYQSGITILILVMRKLRLHEARFQGWDWKRNWWVQAQGPAHHPAAAVENRRQGSTLSVLGKQCGLVWLLVGWVLFWLSSKACRIPDQGLNPGLQQWGYRVLTSELPGNSQQCGFVCFLNKDPLFKDTHGGSSNSFQSIENFLSNEWDSWVYQEGKCPLFASAAQSMPAGKANLNQWFCVICWNSCHSRYLKWLFFHATMWNTVETMKRAQRPIP